MFYTDEINELYKKDKERSLSTIRGYETNMKAIFNKLNISKFNLDLLITKKQEILNLLNTYNSRYRQNILFSIIIPLKNSNKNYIDYEKLLLKTINENQKPEYSEKEKERIKKISKYSLEDIKKKANEYYDIFIKNPNYETSTKALIALLLSYLGLRSQDFINTYYNINEKKNNINSETSLFTLYDGKRNKDKIREIKINNETMDKIILLKEYTENPNKYLIPTLENKNQKYTNSNFTKLVNRLFNINPSDIRQIHSSFLIDNNITYIERQKIASQMGHTITTQNLHYNKASKNNIENIKNYYINIINTKDKEILFLKKELLKEP